MSTKVLHIGPLALPIYSTTSSLSWRSYSSDGFDPATRIGDSHNVSLNGGSTIHAPGAGRWAAAHPACARCSLEGADDSHSRCAPPFSTHKSHAWDNTPLSARLHSSRPLVATSAFMGIRQSTVATTRPQAQRRTDAPPLVSHRVSHLAGAPLLRGSANQAGRAQCQRRLASYHARDAPHRLAACRGWQRLRADRAQRSGAGGAGRLLRRNRRGRARPHPALR